MRVRGEAVGGPTAPRRNIRQTTHDRQGLETKRAFSKEVLIDTATKCKPTLGNLHGCKLVRETGDPRRIVELLERTRRQQSRSGDAQDHQEDQPGEDQPQD